MPHALAGRSHNSCGGSRAHPPVFGCSGPPTRAPKQQLQRPLTQLTHPPTHPRLPTRTLGMLHFSPLITGQAVCRLRRSSSPLGLTEWKSTAVPFLGLAARWYLRGSSGWVGVVVVWVVVVMVGGWVGVGGRPGVEREAREQKEQGAGAGSALRGPAPGVHLAPAAVALAPASLAAAGNSWRAGSPRALAELGAVVTAGGGDVGEHSLPALLHVVQVGQHRGVPVPAVLQWAGARQAVTLEQALQAGQHRGKAFPAVLQWEHKAAVGVGGVGEAATAPTGAQLPSCLGMACWQATSCKLRWEEEGRKAGWLAGKMGLWKGAKAEGWGATPRAQRGRFPANTHLDRQLIKEVVIMAIICSNKAGNMVLNIVPLFQSASVTFSQRSRQMSAGRRHRHDAGASSTGACTCLPGPGLRHC